MINKMNQLMEVMQPNIWASNLFYAIVSMLPFFIAMILIHYIRKRNFIKGYDKGNRHIIRIFFRVINMIIFYLSIVTLFGTFGINVNALLAGLGLTGFALGFALKDVLSSIISTLLILFYRPFIIGSKIKVMDIAGEVVNIDMRYISLKSEEEIHLIPSSRILLEKVTVYKI